MKGALAIAILAAQAQFSGAELSTHTNYIRTLHEGFNNRNLQGTMSRHKAKMKCKKYCSPKKH
jgi:hypothetical protein